VLLTTGLTLVGEGLNDIINPLLRRVGLGTTAVIGAIAPGGVAVPEPGTHPSELEP
jgi:hypothetical protein